MRRSALLWLLLALILGAAIPQVVAAEPVVVRVERDRLKPSETTTVHIAIDVPIKPPGPAAGDPVFTASVAGTLKEVSVTNGEFIYLTDKQNAKFWSGGIKILRDADNPMRAHGEVTLQYTAPPSSPAQEVLLTVQGGQGIRLMGLVEANATTFRGLAKINLLGTPGGGVAPPAANSPFTPTSSATNPTTEIVTRLIPIAILLGAAGIVSSIGRKGRPKPEEPGPFDSGWKFPPLKPATQEPPPAQKPKDQDEDPPPPGIYVHVQPVGLINVPAERAGGGSYPYRGNGSEWIHVAVVLIPTPGWVIGYLPYEGTKGLLPGQPYEMWEEDKSGGWYGGPKPAGTGVMYFKVRVPWEWENRKLDLVTPSFLFDLVNAAGTKRVRRSIPRQSINELLIVLGANPEVSITADKTRVLATGWDSLKFQTTLWLFGRPTEDGAEQVVIEKMTTIIGDRSIDLLYHKCSGRAEDERWTVPFLVQDPQHVDVVELEAICLWKRGKMWPSATEPRRDNPIPQIEDLQTDLVGCSLRTVPVTEFFVPLPKTPLYAKAWLVDGDGHELHSHHLDTDARPGLTLQGSIKQYGGHAYCELRDLSQGRWGSIKGCKIPPKSHLHGDGETPDKPEWAEKKLQEIMARTPIERTIKDLEFSQRARVYTSAAPGGKQRWLLSYSDGGAKLLEKQEDDPEQIFLGEYLPDKDQRDPIHDGPIIYTVVVEDGFGGKVQASGVCRVALGSLVIETGGPDFSIYEYRPHLFQAEYLPGNGYAPRIDLAQNVSLTWEFALVDRDGTPRQNAGSVKTTGTLLSGKFPLVAGYLRRDRIIFINRQNGKVDQVDPKKPADADQYNPREWEQVPEVDDPERKYRERSVTLRRSWHALPFEKQDALRWLPIPGENTANPQAWSDRTLALSVRIELRKDGYLLATSDGLIDNYAPQMDEDESPPVEVRQPATASPASGKGTKPPKKKGPDRSALPVANSRTPPEFVWRDHRFQYVLLAVRLFLRYEGDRPIDQRTYRLSMLGGSFEAISNQHGMIEIWPSVGAETGMMELLTQGHAGAEFEIGSATGMLPAQSGPGRDVWCSFELRFDALEPTSKFIRDEQFDITGAWQRLDNLGMFAGKKQLANAADPAFRRALQRFQILRHLEPSGDFDSATKDALEETHDIAGFIQPPSIGALPRITPQKPTDAKNAPDILRLKPVDNADLPGPPEFLCKRIACVGLHVPNTLRVHGDPWDPSDIGWSYEIGGEASPSPTGTAGAQSPHWFTTAGEPPMQPIRHGNHVKYQIDGPETYRDMVDVLRKATGPDDYIYLLGWFMDPDMELIAGDNQTTMRQILTSASGQASSLGAVIASVSNLTDSATVAQDLRFRTMEWFRKADSSIDSVKMFAPDLRLPRWEFGLLDGDISLAAARLDEISRLVSERSILSGSPGHNVTADELLALKVYAEELRTANAEFARIAAVKRGIDKLKSAVSALSRAMTLRRNALEPTAASEESSKQLDDALEDVNQHVAEIERQKQAASVMSSPGVPFEPDSQQGLQRSLQLLKERAEQAQSAYRAAAELALRHAQEANAAISLARTEAAEASKLASAAGRPPCDGPLSFLCERIRQASVEIRNATERGHGVQVRAMLWCHTSFMNELNKSSIAMINGLGNGAAIHDNLTESTTGAHHQKLLVVKHGSELTAFCGGVDINPDRLFFRGVGPNVNGDTSGAPFHDVHCRVSGSATYDLLRVFIQRWKNHPLHEELDRSDGILRGIADLESPRDNTVHGRHVVQIGRTFGIPSRSAEFGDRRYGFAKKGETSAWKMIRHAIRQAKRFIYIEDQYLTSPKARDELLNKLETTPSLEHVTIVIPPDAFTAMDAWDNISWNIVGGVGAVAAVGALATGVLAPLVVVSGLAISKAAVMTGDNAAVLRKAFLDKLLRDYPNKVRVFVLNQNAVPAQGKSPTREKDWHTYIHAKSWIIDDRYAIIGSANCNIRSYTNDSEIVAGIFDPCTESYCAYRMPRQLRIALWAEHLNMDTEVGHAELADGVASSVHWLRPPEGARVRPYQINPRQSSTILDPMGEPQGTGSDETSAE